MIRYIKHMQGFLLTLLAQHSSIHFHESMLFQVRIGHRDEKGSLDWTKFPSSLRGENGVSVLIFALL